MGEGDFTDVKASRFQGFRPLTMIVVTAALAACSRPASPPTPAPTAIVPAEPVQTFQTLASTLESALPLRKTDPQAYERSLTALRSSPDPLIARRAEALLGLFQLEQKSWAAA